MVDWIGRNVDSLIDHYLAVCMLIGLFILSVIGAGDVRVVSMLGLLLCVTGLAQKTARVDLWIFLPFAGYTLSSMASSWAAYGNMVDGYGVMHLIFPTIYLLMACLGREDQLLVKTGCVLWAGMAAAAGIGQFVYNALVLESPRRMGGVLGNPNAMGIFLVISWFALGHCTAGQRENGGKLHRLLPHLEPLLLAALALTLSMGSFVAMAAGILVLLIGKRKEAAGGSAPGPWKETFRYGSRLLAKASLGVGTGMLLYLAAARTGVPACCLLILGYLLALAYYWKLVDRFLEASPRTAAVMALGGVLVAAAAVLVRPSAAATFAERLEMMRNGLSYLARAPVLGVGPFRWRVLNLADSDKYFNTWHIHNVLLHVGVELGWISMAMLALAAARACIKRHDRSLKAELAAFCTHSLMDTGFFYLGITSLALLTIGEPGQGGKQTGGLVLKALFGIFALIYGYGWYLSMGVKGG